MKTKTAASFLYGSVISAGLAFLPFSTVLAEDATIEVSATVIATCEVAGDGANLIFGDYDPGDDNPTEALTNFHFACTTGTSVFVELDLGGNYVTNHRHMNGPDSNLLEYELYQETARTTVFGNGIHGSNKHFDVAANTPTQVDVYGRIREGQEVPTGAYTDSVGISFAF